MSGASDAGGTDGDSASEEADRLKKQLDQVALVWNHGGMNNAQKKHTVNMLVARLGKSSAPKKLFDEVSTLPAGGSACSDCAQGDVGGDVPRACESGLSSLGDDSDDPRPPLAALAQAAYGLLNSTLPKQSNFGMAIKQPAAISYQLTCRHDATSKARHGMHRAKALAISPCFLDELKLALGVYKMSIAQRLESLEQGHQQLLARVATRAWR